LSAPGVFPYRCQPHSFAVGGGRFGGMTGAVTVAASVVRPPLVMLTQPANQQIFPSPASFVLEAGCAIDPDGTVASVEFFQANGGSPVSIGTDTSSPFNVPVNILTPGSYTFTARATDNTGLISTSAPVVITVQAPPEIRLAAPAFNGGGLFQFNFNSVSGVTYRIDGSTATDSVLPMAEVGSLTATGAVSTFVDPTPRTYRMYRVRLEP
jgi:hypothetical protein